MNKMASNINDSGFNLSGYRESMNLTVSDISKALNMRAEAVHALESGDQAFFGDVGFALIFLRRYLAYFEVNSQESFQVEQNFLKTKAYVQKDKAQYKKPFLYGVCLLLCAFYFMSLSYTFKNKNDYLKGTNIDKLVSTDVNDFDDSNFSYEKDLSSNEVVSDKEITATKDNFTASNVYKKDVYNKRGRNKRVTFTDYANVVISDKDGYVVFAAKTFPGMKATLPDSIDNLNIVSDKNNSWLSSL